MSQQSTTPAPQVDEPAWDNSHLLEQSGPAAEEGGAPTWFDEMLAETDQAGAPGAPSTFTGEVYDKHADMAADYTLETDGMDYSMDAFQRLWTDNRGRYERVAAAAGVPAELVAAIHFRESSGNFDTYLHQGDPLGAPPVHWPTNIPTFYDWEEAAIHALSSKQSVAGDLGMTADTDDMASMATYAEHYNGLGYHNRGFVSPYVWGGTDQYDTGRYVADGKFDPNSVDRRPGVVALIDSVGGGEAPAVQEAPESEAPETEAPAPVNDTYTVRAGDTLGGIAARLAGDTNAWRELWGANRRQIPNPNVIRVGQVLDLPGGWMGGTPEAAPAPQPVPSTYTVRAGDTLSRIAERLGGDANDWRTLWNANRGLIPNPNRISVGQTLTVPAAWGGAPGTEPATPAPQPAPETEPAQPAPQPQPDDNREYDSLAAERGAAAVKSARIEFADGREDYGAGTWEINGSNQGPDVNDYQEANGASRDSDYAWCGMFVGYNFVKAGIRSEITRNLVFWSGYRLHQFFTRGAYVPSGRAGSWYQPHQTTGLSGNGDDRKGQLDGFGVQEGDIALFRNDYSHVAIVANYDEESGRLELIEGNRGNRVQATAYSGGELGEITFLGRFNDSDYGGEVDASLASAADPAVQHSRGGGSTT